MFETALSVAGAIVVLCFVIVFGAIAYRGVKSAKDPAYRAQLQEQDRIRRMRGGAVSSVPDLSDPANPQSPLNPGNPAGPMFPGDSGNPL